MQSPQTSNSKKQEITAVISSVFRIDDTTWGTAQQNFLVRYRGKLYGDSAVAYDKVAEGLKPLGITPLFRIEEGKHVIYLQEGLIQGKRSNPWVNGLLFLLTLLSMLFAGALYGYEGPVTGDTGADLLNLLKSIWRGWPFAVSMLSILLVHEFGHYLAARFHKTDVSLPYFLPFPLSPFGTMGAFIQLKEPPKNKRVLLDIGAAGPLAGLIVTIPILLFGLYTSPVNQLPQDFPPGQGFEGNSLLYLGLKYLAHGELLPQPASYGTTGPILYWIRYFFTGAPLPNGGIDVTLNAVAWAGWAGLLVTALNLMPAGQLDGGHHIYVLFGKKAQKLLPFILGALVLLGLVWPGWWLWVALIAFLGRRYAEPLDQITPLDSGRKAIAILGLILFVLLFTPVPLASPGI